MFDPLTRFGLRVANRLAPTAGLRRRARRALEEDRWRDLTILDAEAGGALLAAMIRSGRPASIGKIGASELRGLRHFEHRGLRIAKYPAWLRAELRLGPGVFPTDRALLDRFHAAYLAAIAEVDLLAVWYQRDEDTVIRAHCRPETRYCELAAIEPHLSQTPWTAELAGRRVLVVSPFARSIAAQYARREAVWRSRPAVLPAFVLETLRCPLSPALVAPSDPDWFATFGRLAEAVERTEFDVMLVGAGAYSLPLCAVAKNKGAIGVHLGGSTQILFGIRGGRWDDRLEVVRHVNEAWIRPSASETPAEAAKVENSCYW